MTTLTKSGIDLRGFRVWKEEEWNDADPPELISSWYIDAEYMVETLEGESWQKHTVRELTGAMKQKGSGLYTDIKAYIEAQEGL